MSSGPSKTPTSLDREKQDIDVEKFLALQESIDRFTGDALVDEIRRVVRRFGASAPSQSEISRFYLEYKPIVDKKVIQIPKLYEAAKKANFDIGKYVKELEAEKEAKKAAAKEKEKDRSKDEDNLQAKYEKDFLNRFSEFDKEQWKYPKCLELLRTKKCGIASCIAFPALLCTWFCSGRPDIPCCQPCVNSKIAEEREKYKNGPLKVIRCQECYVPCCLKVPFSTLYYQIMAQMKAKVDSIVKGGNKVTLEMMKELEVEKEYAIFAIDNFRHDKASDWKKFIEFAKKEKLDFNFAAEKAKQIGDHPITKLAEVNNFPPNHIPSIFDCSKCPDELKAVCGTHHLLRELYLELAGEVKAKFDKLLESLFPGKMKFANLKAERRMIEKLPEYGYPIEGEQKGQYGSRYDRVIDVIRCSYLAMTLDEVLEAGKKFTDIDKLSNGQLKLMRLKNGFREPGKEYPKLGISVIAFDTLICEIQITTGDIKETGAIDHFYYEIIRSPHALSFFQTHYKAAINVPGTGELYPVKWEDSKEYRLYGHGPNAESYRRGHEADEKAKREKMNKNLPIESGSLF